MSVDRWTGRENVVINIQWNIKVLKKRGILSYVSIYQPGGYYSQWNKPATEGQILVIPIIWGI